MQNKLCSLRKKICLPTSAGEASIGSFKLIDRQRFELVAFFEHERSAVPIHQIDSPQRPRPEKRRRC